MNVDLVAPELSDSDEEITLVNWLKKSGDPVSEGEAMAVLETDKSSLDLEAPATGVVAELLVAEGTEGITEGMRLAVIRVGDAQAASRNEVREGPRDDAAEPSRPVPVVELRATEPRPALATQPHSVAVAPKATPVARKMAEQAGVDLAGIVGSGVAGRIIARDVEAALSPPDRGDAESHLPARNTDAPALAAQREPGGAKSPGLVPLTRMRRTIAARMSESKREIPHFYLTLDCTVDALTECRRRLVAAAGGLGPSINDFIVRATALALKRVPEANASWGDGSLRVHDFADVAVAVATDSGLVTPVVRKACGKGLQGISDEIRDLAERARAGRLHRDEYTGGSFTVSNLGMHGIDSAIPIINPPHSGILGVGRAAKRPVVRGDEVVIGTVMTLTLAADHRVVDGSVGAALLVEIGRCLEDPTRMLL